MDSTRCPCDILGMSELKKTIPIGAWNCNFKRFKEIKQTDRLTGRTTDKQMDRPGQREVTLPMIYLPQVSAQTNHKVTLVDLNQKVLDKSGDGGQNKTLTELVSL